MIAAPKICVLSLLLGTPYPLAKPRPVSGGQAPTLASASMALTGSGGLLTSPVLTLLLLVIISSPSAAPLVVTLVVIVSWWQVSGGGGAAECKLLFQIDSQDFTLTVKTRPCPPVSPPLPHDGDARGHGDPRAPIVRARSLALHQVITHKPGPTVIN